MLSLFRDELYLREERGAVDTYNTHAFNICVQRIKNGAKKVMCERSLGRLLIYAKADSRCLNVANLDGET